MRNPVIKEEFDTDRTNIILSLEKTSDKTQTSISKKSTKTLENIRKILEYLKDNGRSKCTDIADFIGLSKSNH